MYTLVNMQDVQSGVIVAIRTFLLHICEPIYKLIVFCFNIFEQFGSVRLFESSSTISEIYNRIGLILGLFMVFRLTFSAIGYIVNPDNILDKSKGIGNIVKKVLIVLVLLGSTRFLFDFAYELQDRLIKSHIVSKIILNKNFADGGVGSDIAWYTFTNFYRINDETSAMIEYNDTNAKYIDICEEILSEGGTLYDDFYENGSLKNAELCLNLASEGDYSLSNLNTKINIIDFNGVFCLAVGIFLLWTIFTYTVQLGVRVLQLAYLELIAPLPIMMYLMPDGESKLSAWAKQCLITFLDFFIRLAIMDFIILVSTALIDLSNSLFIGNFSLSNSWQEGYIIVIMIIALMIFAKRIPQLLGEILPSMGGAASLGFGFGATGEAKKVGGFLGGVAGGAIGATAGGVLNAGVSAIDNLRAAKNVGRNRFGAAMHGLGSGALIGIRNGAKKGNVFKNIGAGMSARKAADRNYEQLLAQGGSATGKIKSQITSHFGMTKGQEYERMRSNANRMDEFVKNIRSSIDEVDSVKKAKAAYEHFTPTADMSYQEAQARRTALYEDYKKLRKAYTDVALGTRDFDEVQQTEGITFSGNDLLHLTEARQQGAAANAFADSVHAKHTDINGEQHNFTRIADDSSLGEVGLQANTTEAMITGSEDYIRTKANDEAAGVNKTNNN